MFQATVALVPRHHEEQVAVEAGRRAEKRVLCLAEPGEVVAQARHVELRVAAHRDRMRNTGRLELADQDLAHLDRMIDQLGIIRRGVAAELVTVRARPRPDRGEYRGPVEEAVCPVQVGAAHAEVPRVDRRGQRERRLAGIGHPGALVGLQETDGFAFSARVNLHHASRHVADQVTAGDPCGKRERLSGRVRRLYGDRHLEEPRLGIGRADPVPVRCRHTSPSLIR